MSNITSALNGARATTDLAEIQEIGQMGMITLRGDFTQAGFKKGLAAIGEIAIPKQGQISSDGAVSLAWMSPDELLLICPYVDAPALVQKINTGFAQAHALAVDVSDARAVFRLGGAHAREIMGKLAPVDFAADLFVPGMFRRSRMAQIAAAFWMLDAQSFQIICFRSNAQYMFDLLKVAAQNGSEVHLY